MIDIKKLIRKRNRKELERFVKVVYEVLLRRSVDKESLSGHVMSLLDGMKNSQFIEIIGTSDEFKLATGFSLIQKEIENNNSLITFIGNECRFKKVKKLIYFSPSIKREVGGIKVIMRHCDIFNQVSDEISSEVFFPQNNNTQISWFDHKAKIKKDGIFNIETDFVILPEVMVLDYGELLISSKIRYGIFVQNGYDIFTKIDVNEFNTIKMLKDTYEKASLILTISDDTTECVAYTFSSSQNKIIQLIPSVDGKIFHSADKKQNIISYMPRKLSVQSSWLIGQIKLLEDKNWRISPIVGLTERGVAEILSVSKIFLSFSDREGLSLPPLEAALSGNLVIGYTGEGAKEYWNGGLFKRIESGNLINFLNELIKEMVEKKSDASFCEFLENNSEQILSLQEKYSYSQERDRLRVFADFLRGL